MKNYIKLYVSCAAFFAIVGDLSISVPTFHNRWLTSWGPSLNRAVCLAVTLADPLCAPITPGVQVTLTSYFAITARRCKLLLTRESKRSLVIAQGQNDLHIHNHRSSHEICACCCCCYCNQPWPQLLELQTLPLLLLLLLGCKVSPASLPTTLCHRPAPFAVWCLCPHSSQPCGDRPSSCSPSRLLSSHHCRWGRHVQSALKQASDTWMTCGGHKIIAFLRLHVSVTTSVACTLFDIIGPKFSDNIMGGAVVLWSCDFSCKRAPACTSTICVVGRACERFLRQSSFSKPTALLWLIDYLFSDSHRASEALCTSQHCEGSSCSTKMFFSTHTHTHPWCRDTTAAFRMFTTRLYFGPYAKSCAKCILTWAPDAKTTSCCFFLKWTFGKQLKFISFAQYSLLQIDVCKLQM